MFFQGCKIAKELRLTINLRVLFLSLMLFFFSIQLTAGGALSSLCPDEEEGERQHLTRPKVQQQRPSRVQTRQPETTRVPNYFELKGSWFYLDCVSDTIPREGNDDPRCASLSTPLRHPFEEEAYDKRKDWPSVHNASIFSYLYEIYQQGEYASNFAKFVANNYRSSCALVYYDPYKDMPVILGSGGLINNYQTVATARHVVEGLDISRVFARFHNYSFNKTKSGRPVVLVDYIDVGIRSAQNAEGGLDASWIRLKEIPSGLSEKYMSRVREAEATWGDESARPPGTMTDQTLPTGKYALFHFAYGHHLVSVGDIQAPDTGSWLHSNIGIEAGSGASGAVPLRRISDGRGQFYTAGYGVSIYRRRIADGFRIQPERRIIPFWNFNQGLGDFDKVTTPYANGKGPNLMVPSFKKFDDDGYEYLLWQKEFNKLRERNPGSDVYHCAPGKNCHHIIPNPDLVYLWNYFVEGDNIFQRKDWTKFSAIIRSLCPPSIQQNGKPRLNEKREVLTNFEKKQFAWAWWNLFKGWSERDDDSRNLAWRDSKKDFSERNMPIHFKKDLWEHVKSLYPEIQRLKRISLSKKRPVEREKSQKDVEDAIYQALTNIRKTWYSLFKVNKKREVTSFPKIHEHNDDEWLLVGGKTDKAGDLKNVYIVRH